MRYRLHGLTIDCPIELQARPARPDDPADLVVVVEPVVATERGATVLVNEWDGHRHLHVTSEPDGYLFTYDRPVRALVAQHLDQVTIWADDDELWPIVPILLEGWIIAFVLQMRGACVLHASAVVVDDGAIAFVGNSGMGKSTLATLLCAHGARLLADDVLRVEPAAGTAHAGSDATRLRDAVAALASAFPAADSRPTPDGRVSVKARASLGLDVVPLLAIAVPWPDRAATTVEASVLEPRVALHALLQYPRVYEWQVPDPMARQFQAVAELVRSVPVLDLTVPWGPPWPPGIADEIVARCHSARAVGG